MTSDKLGRLKVYFDVSTLNPERPIGVSVYMLSLIKGLSKRPDVDLKLVVKPSRFQRKGYLERTLGQTVQVLFPWVGRGENWAIYHGPDFKLNQGPFLKGVVTVHDMAIFEGKYHKPDFVESSTENFKMMMKQGPTVVLTNSEFTKSQLLKYFPEFPCDRVQVTRLGGERLTGLSGVVSGGEGFSFRRPYILFVGQIEERKNVLGVVKAYELLCRTLGEGERPDLVLAGGREGSPDALWEHISRSEFKVHIHALGYVGEDRLEQLYREAALFVYPSFYEGFGLPIIEAFRSRCPVVTSDLGALKEVAGDAAVLVQPDSPESIMEGMRSVFVDSGLREGLVSKGSQRSLEFTWERCCEQTVSQYLRALTLD